MNFYDGCEVTASQMYTLMEYGYNFNKNKQFTHMYIYLFEALNPDLM